MSEATELDTKIKEELDSLRLQFTLIQYRRLCSWHGLPALLRAEDGGKAKETWGNALLHQALWQAASAKVSRANLERRARARLDESIAAPTLDVEDISYVD